jgi:hypothetical protein
MAGMHGGVWLGARDALRDSRCDVVHPVSCFSGHDQLSIPSSRGMWTVEPEARWRFAAGRHARNQGCRALPTRSSLVPSAMRILVGFDPEHVQ